jgi:hypothetical protein
MVSLEFAVLTGSWDCRKSKELFGKSIEKLVLCFCSGIIFKNVIEVNI